MYHCFKSGLDVHRNGSPDMNPVAGTDVTLTCRAYVFRSEPEWGFYRTVNDTQELIYINQFDPPSEFGMFFK